MVNKRLSLYAIIVASYTTICLLLGNFSFGLVQIRLSELLLVLCLVDKRYVLPITIGCFISNLIGVLSGTNIMALDFIVGTLATYISGLCVYTFKDLKIFSKPMISLLLPTIVNGLMVGIEISIYLSVNLVLSIVYVAVGELISVTILGLLFYEPIIKIIKQYTEWYNYSMNIDISKLETIKNELDSLQENDAIFVSENGIEKYAVMPVETYNKVCDLLDALDQTNPLNAKIDVIGDRQQLTYEEYERVKSLIMEAVEKAFKPKADKLN